MQLILSNYGHRCFKAFQRNNNLVPLYDGLEIFTLTQVMSKLSIPYEDNPVINRLLKDGLLEEANLRSEEIRQKYDWNPLEHVEEVIFEYTTRCNLNCKACYNSKVTRTTETDIKALKEVADSSIKMGVNKFAFIGGEVSKYGDNWIELASYIRKQADVKIGLVTNGWFCLEPGPFTAAGQVYSCIEHYLATLKINGITHVLFSLDGEDKEHNTSRGKQGLYESILNGFKKVRSAGLEARVSLLVGEESVDYLHKREFLVKVADLIYDFSPGTERDSKVEHLLNDETNILSNRIDIGNDARVNEGDIELDLTDSMLKCKAFFRPSFLTVKANGELATCRLSNIGEGYGNIHKRNFVSVLNSMQDSFIAKLHAEGRIGEYRRYFRSAIFGNKFDHVCTLRSILTAIAKRVNEINPKDEETILKINQEVARYTGHA